MQFSLVVKLQVLRYSVRSSETSFIPDIDIFISVQVQLEMLISATSGASIAGTVYA